MKGGLKHILIKETRNRLAAPKGRDMSSLLRILSIMTDGFLKHLVSTLPDEEDEENLGERRHELCRLIDSYNAYMELSRVAAPTGAPRLA